MSRDVSGGVVLSRHDVFVIVQPEISVVTLVTIAQPFLLGEKFRKSAVKDKLVKTNIFKHLLSQVIS